MSPTVPLPVLLEQPHQAASIAGEHSVLAFTTDGVD